MPPSAPPGAASKGHPCLHAPAAGTSPTVGSYLPAPRVAATTVSSARPLHIAYLTPHYRAFIKDQIEASAPLIESACVLSRSNVLANLALLPGIGRLTGGRQRYARRHAISEDEVPANVMVRPLSVAYLRPDSINPRLGKLLARAALRELRRVGYQPTMVHGHFLHPHGAAAAEVAKRLGVPCVLTAHGFDVYDLPFKNRRWRRLIEDTLAAADVVITVSRRNEKILVEQLGVDPSRVVTVPNGFDPAKFDSRRTRTEARARLGLAADATVLLTVGHLVAIKNHQLLLEAYSLLKRPAGTKLVLVGDGPLRAQLEKQARDLQISHEVQFTGDVPHEDVGWWMAAADLFVLPSLDEGNPTVLFEALASGLPYIGSRVGGVPEIVTSPAFGTMVAPGDGRALADALQAGMEASWDSAAIQQHGQQFAWPRLAELLVAAYDRVDAG